MRCHFFQIPAHGDSATAAALNACLARNRVHEVERHFVAAGIDSFWAICVTTVEGEARAGVISGPRAAGKERIDYREILSAPEFAAYAKLREVRKRLAARDGVPARLCVWWRA